MKFEEEYEKLNAKQKEAVDAIDGPVLVIAGAGTGKTQLLSMRVANILRTTDTDARNILCLTFTNKAATNMRERLQVLTDGEARNVHVKTFHGFASEIMNNYSQYFWNGANLKSAPEAVELSILESIISSLPLDNPYATKFYGTYTMLGKAQKAIARAKEAGLTPDKLRALLHANLAYIDEIEPQLVEALTPSVSHKKLPELVEAISALPEQPTDALTTPLISLATKIQESLAFAVAQDEPSGKATNTSNWKKDWITTEDGVKGLHVQRRRNKQWLELADIYEQYRDQLHKRGYYDYSDMLLEVIVQMESHSDLRAEIQERFNYVLIDEFQDSNTAQLRLAHLVADHHSAEGKPNIMAVGDDDQSIYGFNGAELNNMLHFERTYGSEVVKTIVLTDNYRSTNEVLEASESIITNSQDRLVNRIPGLTKKLVAKTHDLPNGEILHQQYLNQEHEQYMLAYDIKKRWDSHPNQTITVLARSHKSLEPLAAQLHNLNVPIRYERQQNILEHEAVLQVINVCRVVQALLTGDQETANAVLCQLLRHPMFCLENEILWKLAEENRYSPQWLASILSTPETTEFGEWLNWLTTEASYQPLSLIIEHIIGIREDSSQSYLRHYYVEDQRLSSTYIQTLSAIRLLRELVNEFTPASTAVLKDFLLFIDTETANHKTISDNSALISGGSAVELLSVHKAKGLEFDCVYIIDAVEKDWQPSGGREGVPANLPLQPPLETEDEYVRLMYVAATRAKHTIVFASYRKNGAGEDVLPTSLIRAFAPIEMNEPTEDQTVAILETALAWPRLNATTEKEILGDILERFSINATNLIGFLDVTEGGPGTFLERSLLRLPSVKSDFMSHGTAIHSALELAQKQVNLGAFSLDTIKEEYRHTLQKEHLPADQLTKQTVYGEKILDKLFTDLGYTLQKGSIPEQSLSRLVVGDALVGGKLDRIDYLDADSIRIVDYKTGSGLSSFTTKDKTKEVKVWKHTLQLTFYALLAQVDPELSKYKNIEGQMVYVESSYAKGLTLSYTPTQEEIDRLAKLIQAVWHKVKNYDLPDTSHYEPTLAGIKQFEQDLLGA